LPGMVISELDHSRLLSLTLLSSFGILGLIRDTNINDETMYPLNKINLRNIRVFSCLVFSLVACLTSAETNISMSDLAVESSFGGSDFRTREVRAYFARMGRDFEIYRIILPAPEDASYLSGTKQYHLDRDRAGNFRYNSLKVSGAVFYKAVANSVNINFLPLVDTVNNDDSGVTGTELLQMIYRQAKALNRSHADLDAVDKRVTVTYVYDGRHLVIAPTTFNFVDNAVNADGTSLHKKFGVNSFSKHYLLALILNEQAEVTMAGKIYVRVLARESGTPVDLAHVFAADGEVNLDAYKFDLTVTNESGTFKPLSEGLSPFARVLVDGLGLTHLNYRGHVGQGKEPVAGTVYPSEK
jgi:hypothetical protein